MESKLVNSRGREEQTVVAAGIKRLQSVVAKQGQGLGPGVERLEQTWCCERLSVLGGGWSVTRVFPHTETSHR